MFCDLRRRKSIASEALNVAVLHVSCCPLRESLVTVCGTAPEARDICLTDLLITWIRELNSSVTSPYRSGPRRKPPPAVRRTTADAAEVTSDKYEGQAYGRYVPLSYQPQALQLCEVIAIGCLFINLTVLLTKVSFSDKESAIAASLYCSVH